MERIDSYLLQEIFYNLDLETLQTCTLVNKDWNTIITQGHFWKNKFTQKKPSSYHSGPYFSYSNYKTYLDSLHPIDHKITDYESLKALGNKLKNPQNLKIVSTSASSEDYDQVSGSILKYDSLFWSSSPNQSPDSDEFILFTLESESLIFTVNFKVYRASHQEGTLYPPKFIKVSIGKTSEAFEYESDEFEVKLSENYNTILILPNIVSGKFVKLTMIGKQSREPGTELWYTVMRFAEIVGYPNEFSIDPVLEMCREGSFKGTDLILTPFYFERLERFKKVKEYLETKGMQKSDISAYFSEIYPSEVIQNEFPFYCEILGNYFFEKGEYDKARAHYVRIIDIWGYSRICIVQKKFNDLIKIMSEVNPRRPSKGWVLKTAKDIGGKELENELIEVLNSIE